MDRKLSQKEKAKVRNRMLFRNMLWIIVVLGVSAAAIRMLGGRLEPGDLEFSTVDEGVIEFSVSAMGRVVPAFEEIINSPIDTRIVRVCKKSGDLLEAGTPILELDLEQTETAYRKMLDQEQMKCCELEQLRIGKQTELNDLAMRVKICAMSLGRKVVELRNERYLDSLGSGTTDRVRQAELAFNTGRLELEQLRQMYENGQKGAQADLKMKELELRIFRKELAEMRRTLEDAEIRSPRKGVLTHIRDQVGARIACGEQVAVISDLSRFKIDCEVADCFGDRISVGYGAVVKIGSERLAGKVSGVTPLSRNGLISFTVIPDEDSHKALRSGLMTEVHVQYALRSGVLRIANGPYYKGRGECTLFVRDGDRLRRRRVLLGDCNFDYVEVVDGLHAGDCVVVSNMDEFKDRETIKLK